MRCLHSTRPSSKTPGAATALCTSLKYPLLRLLLVNLLNPRSNMQTSFQALIFALCALSHTRQVVARIQYGYRHEAVDAAHRRQALPSLTISYTVTEQCTASTATPASILSIVWPSPDASPVEITSQSQVVTSYIPAFTWCVGPPIEWMANATLGPPFLNYSTTQYAMTAVGTGSCETAYVPTQTTVCATTLTALATKIPITDCDQEVTFSSECGFTLETPTPTAANLSLITPAPTLKRMMTYWMAPWQSLTLGEVPSDVDIKVCTFLDSLEMECTSYQEVWEVVVVTSTITTQRQVDLTTTVSGPGLLIIETVHANITDTIHTVALSTMLMTHTEIETESISTSPKSSTLTETETAPISTEYITKHVKYASSR